MDNLFIHNVRRPNIHSGYTVSFTTYRLSSAGRVPVQQVGTAQKRIGTVWDVIVTKNGKTCTWQVPREDLNIVQTLRK